jgi:hypothetical protein
MKNCNLLKNIIGICLLALMIMSSCKKDATVDATENLPDRGGKAGLKSVYLIPVGTITDHSDSTITGSIAWYFNHYGVLNTYYLSSNGYYI